MFFSLIFCCGMTRRKVVQCKTKQYSLVNTLKIKKEFPQTMHFQARSERSSAEGAKFIDE